MAVTFFRGRNVWIKIGAHPCWRVRRELDNAGIDYTIVRGPVSRGGTPPGAQAHDHHDHQHEGPPV